MKTKKNIYEKPHSLFIWGWYVHWKLNKISNIFIIRSLYLHVPLNRIVSNWCYSLKRMKARRRKRERTKWKKPLNLIIWKKKKKIKKKTKQPMAHDRNKFAYRCMVYRIYSHPNILSTLHTEFSMQLSFFLSLSHFYDNDDTSLETIMKTEARKYIYFRFVFFTIFSHIFYYYYYYYCYCERR